MFLPLLKNLFILLILAGLVIGATKFIPQLREKTNSQFSKVLGTKTQKESAKKLSESLRNDASSQIEELKDKALHITLSDVLTTIDRLQKVPRDLSNLGKSVGETVTTITSGK